MHQFRFIRVVQYTEVVEVEAEDLAAAKRAALEADGEHQNDDSVQEIRQLPTK